MITKTALNTQLFYYITKLKTFQYFTGLKKFYDMKLQFLFITLEKYSITHRKSFYVCIILKPIIFRIVICVTILVANLLNLTLHFQYIFGELLPIYCDLAHT